MNIQQTLDPVALGRILLLQSTLPVASDEKRLTEMIAYGMSSLPGVGECLVCIEGTTDEVNSISDTPEQAICSIASDDAISSCASICPIELDNSWHRIVLQTSRCDYGTLFLKIEDRELFEPYSGFANNTANLVALHIENDRTAAELNTLNRGLDQQVRERTQQLQESENHLREAQKVARIGSFEAYHLEDKFWWSDELFHLHGLDPDNFSPTPDSFFELLHPDDVEDYTALRKHSLQTGEALIKEYKAKRGDGEWGYFETRGNVIFSNQGEIVGMRGTVQDITERKQAEEEKKDLQAHLRHSQKMDAVGQLAAGVAHEFNNILVGILGNTDLLLLTSGDDLPENFRRPLKDIERAGTRAADLTKQLLSFARKKSPNVSYFDVNRVITGCMGLLQQLVNSNITLKFLLASNPLLVQADESNVEQAITNLVLNARDAMPYGGTLTIQTETIMLEDNDAVPDCKPGPYVRLSVMDDGCGIPPAVQERIFEPFFTTKRVGKGTGLGLSTIFADVNSNGGFITVDSHVGEGSKFCVHLPQLEGASEPIDTDTKHSSQPCGGNETILVCDDEEIVVKSVSALLKTLGYAVIGANSPHEAVEAAKTHVGTISLLLTDMSMPEMNGIQLSKVITQLIPEIKVIVTSGYAEDVSKTGKGESECYEFIQKPAPYNLLSSTIRKVLDKEKVSEQ